MKRNKNILISGAGIAGLTLAYWLKRYGFNPTLVEKHPNLKSGGYKIDIRGVAVEVVKRMGIYTSIFEERTAIQKAVFVDSSGKHLTETTPDLCGVRAKGDLEIVRGNLCQILFNQLSDIECLFDDSIQAITQSEKGVQVEFEKNEPRHFDLVIGADGLHSKVRTLVFGEESHFLRELGLYASFYSIPNFLDLDRVEIEFRLPKKLVITYCPRDGMAIAGFAFSAPSPQFALFEKSQQQKFLEEVFVDAGWEVSRLLTYMKEAPDFYFDCMAQVVMPHWGNGRVALVGDAGYAVSPIVGQGSSIALVGSYVLASELAQAQGDQSQAFPRYEDCLREYVEKNQALSKMSTAIMGANGPSWIVSTIQKLRKLMPGSCIRFFKNLGLRRTTKAANALTLKNYAIIE